MKLSIVVAAALSFLLLFHVAEGGNTRRECNSQCTDGTCNAPGANIGCENGPTPTGSGIVLEDVLEDVRKVIEDW